MDQEIQAVGFIPDATKYGMNGQPTANGNGHHRQHEGAGISEKQLDLVNRIVKENNANKTEIENLALEMFGGGVRTLNRMQASNFIGSLAISARHRGGRTGRASSELVCRQAGGSATFGPAPLPGAPRSSHEQED